MERLHRPRHPHPVRQDLRRRDGVRPSPQGGDGVRDQHTHHPERSEAVHVRRTLRRLQGILETGEGSMSHPKTRAPEVPVRVSEEDYRELCETASSLLRKACSAVRRAYPGTHIALREHLAVKLAQQVLKEVDEASSHVLTPAANLDFQGKRWT